MQKLDLEKLPPFARAELLDFYEFLLEKYKQPEAGGEPTEKESRWKRVAERVHHDRRHPGAWSKQLKDDMQSFRETFRFRHDDE